MPKRKYEIRDRHGRLVEDDGSGILRDGHTLRVPLWLCDSNDELQRSVAKDAEARKRWWSTATEDRRGFARARVTCGRRLRGRPTPLSR
jgi:hypothetical protein